MTKASGAISATAIDMISRAACQSNNSISRWPAGTTRNWPSEPPALATPSAALRASGEVARPITGMTSAEVVPPCPIPTISPKKITRPSCESTHSVPARPAA